VSVLRRLLIAACALTLLSAPVALADSGAANAGKGKKCKHGYRLKTVTKHGKKVKVCGKARGKRKTEGKGQPSPSAPSHPAPAPPASPAPTLFEAPGRQLNGDEAKPFLQKYLANSTFTDCPTGWPACGGFEDRYSHSADGTFYKCWLRPTSGSDVKSVGEYGVDNARVEPDGSWIFQETVYWYGDYAGFEWRVSTAGTVEGAYQSDPAVAPEKIGPLQYVAGGAKSCSY
jgi:hypothetical protein